MTDPEASRRNLITGLAAAGVAVPLLAACGDDSDPAAGPGTSTATSGSPSASGGTSSGAPDAGAIQTSEIPVGSGKIFKDDKIVVTQPTAGEFKAFSAVCPHQGCILSDVEDDIVACRGCHDSEFSIADGSVEKGPATKGLAEKTVTVTGATLTVA